VRGKKARVDAKSETKSEMIKLKFLKMKNSKTFFNYAPCVISESLTGFSGSLSASF